MLFAVLLQSRCSATAKLMQRHCKLLQCYCKLLQCYCKVVCSVTADRLQ